MAKVDMVVKEPEYVLTMNQAQLDKLAGVLGIVIMGDDTQELFDLINPLTVVNYIVCDSDGAEVPLIHLKAKE